MNEPMADISRHVWETKYRYAHECTIADSWRRIALALAAVEPHDPAGWEARFLRILQGYKFLPGGRIQAGAGTARNVTLFNCFVMGSIEDSIPGIFKSLAGKRGHDAAGWRHRAGLLDFAASRHKSDEHRNHCVGSRVVHADLGSYVRNHPVDWLPTGSHDGNTALRSSGHRRIHRRQAAAGTTEPLQPVDPGDGRVHDGGAQRWRMAVGLSCRRAQRRWRDGVARMAGLYPGGTVRRY